MKSPSSVGRIGDMHPRRALRISIEKDSDIIVSIEDEGMLVDSEAIVEFCCLASGGGRSERVRQALVALAKAMQEDNEARPDANPDI